MPGSELLVLAVSRRTTEFSASLMELDHVGLVNKLAYIKIGVDHHHESYVSCDFHVTVYGSI
jgi:hypothetical protein